MARYKVTRDTFTPADPARIRRQRLLRNALLFALIGGLTVLALAVVFNQEWREAFVSAVLSYYWALYQLLTAIDKWIYWLLLLIVFLRIAIQSFMGKTIVGRSEATDKRTHRGPIETINRRLRFVQKGDFFEKQMTQRVLDANLEVLSGHSKLTPQEAIKKIDNGELALSTNGQRFMRQALENKIKRRHWGDEKSTSRVDQLRERFLPRQIRGYIEPGWLELIELSEKELEN